jgi:hypothetical protein
MLEEQDTGRRRILRGAGFREEQNLERSRM